MIFMRKFGVILATAVLSCGLVACGTENKDASAKKSDDSVPVVKNETDMGNSVVENGIESGSQDEDDKFDFSSVTFNDPVNFSSDTLVDSYISVGNTELVFGETTLADIINSSDFDFGERTLLVDSRDSSGNFCGGHFDEKDGISLSDALKNFDENTSLSGNASFAIRVLGGNNNTFDYLCSLAFEPLDKSTGTSLKDFVLCYADLSDVKSVYDESVGKRVSVKNAENAPDVSVFSKDFVLGQVTSNDFSEFLKEAGYTSESDGQDKNVTIYCDVNTSKLGSVHKECDIDGDGICSHVHIIKL